MLSNDEKIFTIAKKNLGCSQPYLNQNKLTKLENVLLDDNPLPVMIFEKKYFLSDGHTRAFLIKDDVVKVYLDCDLMDLNSMYEDYITFINWTQELGVYSIDDLKNRVISEDEFKEKWIKRCEDYLQQKDR